MHENLGPKLDALFRAYRQACPDPEPGADFMPKLWGRIEARQGIPLAVLRLGRVFVSASAALCLAMVLLLLSPLSQNSSVSMTYVEALSNSDPHEVMAYAGVETDNGDSSWK
jgi:hypothetical protein